ncbi:MAG: methylamine dehydrogenase accessory protein MauD [Betaproteobacteria bacterium CG2_30_68_42]|nr:MAG: methylamine dehydrogenase accessory protein MauD [Betaproteobacteria bacterium CG2_30_68_42]
MNEALMVSNIILWVVVLALVVALVALARQVGILYERVAPIGALMMDSGPKVGDEAPAFDLVDLAGQAVSLGKPADRSTLLFFLSPSCPVCKKLVPILGSISRSEAAWLRIVFASDGEPAQHAELQRKAGLAGFPYVLSTELGMTYRIGKLPYAVLIDDAGRIGAKGLVNSREQIESLFAAKELGVASVQEFIDQKARA